MPDGPDEEADAERWWTDAREVDVGRYNDGSSPSMQDLKLDAGPQALSGGAAVGVCEVTLVADPCRPQVAFTTPAVELISGWVGVTT